MSTLGAIEPEREAFGARYTVINRLGRGGGGDVHRVLDRMTGRVVTLKALRVPTSPEGPGDSLSLRQEFVREFRVLSTLRHPNVISVLDFGFTAGRPWFTMDLQEHAEPMLDAARGRPIAVQLELVVQLLRALHYVHGRGVLHRDVKPENVVVVSGVVKLLDFGLWAEVGGWRVRNDVSGTLAWMAPEVLHGAPASPASDLYAVGLLLLAMQLGRPPYDPTAGVVPITSGDAIALVDEADPALEPLLVRLLARHPRDRFASAAEAIEACSGLTSPPLCVETVTTRESLLNHAELVGREREVLVGEEALKDAKAGRGGVVMIGGESGVGKSRLVGELRTRALVQGFLVVTGEAVSSGGEPFHLWRDVVRLLTLDHAPDPRQRELLARVDPWLGAEGGGTDDEVGAASEVFAAVEDLVEAFDEPLLIVLEDLQWARPVSVDLLRWLAPMVTRRQVLIVGTFRDDEGPDLAHVVHESRLLRLARLDAEQVASLVASMLGVARPPSELVDYAYRHTEGLPFFLVEVLRDLAGRAGSLPLVHGANLPRSLATDGMRRVLRKRLQRLGEEAVDALGTAAVVGRRIEPALIAALHPELDVDAWIASCAEASVLSAHGASWTFDHDKLRELLLDELLPEERASIHRAVATWLEPEAEDARERAMRLAWHWRGAGDRAREAVWAERSGMEALRAGAAREALNLLGRARVLVDGSDEHPATRTGLVPASRLAGDPDAATVARLERGMCQAAYQLGDLTTCREHALRTLAALGVHPPSGTLGLLRGIVGEVGTRLLQALTGARARPGTYSEEALADAAVAYTLLTETWFYSHEALAVLWTTLRHVNLASPHGASATLAESWVLLGLLLGSSPTGDAGAGLRGRALAMARELASPRTQGKMLNRLAVYHLGFAHWDEAARGLQVAQKVAADHDDRRLFEETQAMRGIMHFYQGQFDEAVALWDVGYDLVRQSGNRQVELWTHLCRGDVAVRRRRVDEARTCFQRAEALLMPGATRTEELWLYGCWSLIELEAGDELRAVELARRSLDLSCGRLPIAYWTQQGLYASAETVLRIHARRPGTMARDLTRARRAMRLYASIFAHAGPAHRLWDGLALAARGRRGAARRQVLAALSEAERLGMLYEAACARRELSVLDPANAAEHARIAGEAFDVLGCSPERRVPLIPERPA